MNRAAELLARSIPERGDQTKLAEETGIDQGYLSRIVNGDRVPGLEVRRKLKRRFPELELHLWDEPARSKTGSAA